MQRRSRSHRIQSPRAWSWLAAAACLALSGAARAEELPSPLKPDAVLKYAVDHRAEIVAAKARAAAATEVPKQVRALPDPMVMASINHLPFSLEGVNASLVYQQNFPLSGVLGARGRAAEAGAQAAGADVGTAKLDVEYQALAAYLKVVLAQREAAVLDEQVAVAKQVVATAEARLSSTSAAAADVLRARLDLARLEGERAAQDADIKAAAAALEAALGRPVKGEAPATDLTLPGTDPPALAELLKKAESHRPELAAARASVSRAAAEVDVMQSMYAPNAFVRAGGAYTMADGPGLMLMVGVTIPLWREKLSAGVAEARATRAAADAGVSATAKVIEGDVGAARQAVVAARIRLTTIRDKVLPLARSVITLTIGTYAAGQVPLVSVLDAVKALRDARMEEVKAEVQAAEAWARLGRAIGVVKLGV